MLRLLLPLSILLLGSAPPAPPRRIVSLDLCTDQLVLALADRRQIAAVTRLAQDPAMSAEMRRARGLRTVRGSAEEVVDLRPDLILGAPYRLSSIMPPLARLGVRSVAIEDAASYAAIVANIRSVAAAVGHRERGRALVARMDAALARLPRDMGRGRTAAYYQRRGYLTGSGTLVDELFRRVGLRNLATGLGKAPLSRLSLEELALARPDVLVVDSATDRVADRGAEMLHHPLIATIPHLRIPEAWTVCGGPAYVAAAEALSAQLARAPRR